MKVKTILVSQPEPKVENSPYFDLQHHQKVKIVQNNFDLSPSGLIENLNLLNPIYLKTASYGHFGRENAGFKWEEVKDL